MRDCERIFQFPIQTQAQQDDKLLAGQVVTREGEGSWKGQEESQGRGRRSRSAATAEETE